MQSQIDSQHGPLPHPKRCLHPGVCYVQPLRLPPSPLLLKESTQMEKWQALRRHQPCRSQLPSLCFFSPCDHICICLRAETLEIYGLETDKDELLRPALPLFYSL